MGMVDRGLQRPEEADTTECRSVSCLGALLCRIAPAQFERVDLESNRQLIDSGLNGK
jgi:hypothetical protein